MKKIILGAVFTYVLAVGGDVKKCGEAIDMQAKYGERAYDALKSQRGETLASSRELFENVESLNRHFVSLWQNTAKIECEGILKDKEYTFATTGAFHQ